MKLIQTTIFFCYQKKYSFMSKIKTAPFLIGNLKKFSFIECFYDIISKEQTLAFFFLPLCDSKNLKNSLKIIFQQLDINQATLDIRWSIRSFLGYLNDHNENDLSREMATIDFLKADDHIINIIKSYINFKYYDNKNAENQKEIDNKTAHNLSFYLQLLRDTHPGIFNSIIPDIQELVIRIGVERVFNAIGFNIVSFFTEQPFDFFQNLKEFDTNDAPSLFQLPDIYRNNRLSNLIQSKIIEMFPFPNAIKTIEKSKEYSIVNNSLAKNSHFIDIILKYSCELFIKCSNPDEIIDSLYFIRDFLPYIIIHNQSIVYSDINHFYPLLNICNESKNENIILAFQLLERFKNDFILLNVLSSLTNEEYCYGDLLTESIPSILQLHLNDLNNDDLSENPSTKNICCCEEILKLSNLTFFTISDKLANQDFDFIKCYYAMILFFSIWDLPASKNIKFKRTIKQIHSLLSSIKDPDIQNSIVVDMFSCFFIPFTYDINDKNDIQLICKPYVAEKLINQVFMPLNAISYISGANKMFEKRKIPKSDQNINLSIWLDKNEARLIYEAIDSSNWAVADKLSSFLPYYRKLYLRSHAANQFIKEGADPHNNLIKLEVFLSLAENYEQLDVLKGRYKAYEEIINKHMNKKEDMLLEPINNDVIAKFNDKWIDVTNYAASFDENPLSKVKKIPQFSNITINNHHLHNFLDYLLKYYKCALLDDSTTYDSLEDLFNFNFQRALAGPIKVGEYQQAEELAKSSKFDLYCFIFENLSHFDFDISFLKKIYELFPIETTAFAISNNVSIPSINKDLYKINQALFNHADNQETIMDDIIERFSKNGVSDIEDLIFRVDHKSLFDRLLLSFNNQQLSDKYYELFSIVSYTATESDDFRIKQIEIYKNALRITNKNNTNDILHHLTTDSLDIPNLRYKPEFIQKFHDKFTLSLMFLKYCVPKNDLLSPLYTLFSDYLSKSISIEKRNAYISKILQAFPERYDLFLSRFFHVNGIIQQMIKFAPNEKQKLYLIGLSDLPKQIFDESNIFDLDSIAHSYSQNRAIFLIEMPDSIANMFSEEQMFHILNGFSNSKKIHQICCHMLQLHRFSDNPKMMLQLYSFWNTSIGNKIRSIKVNSIQEENYANEYMKGLRSFIKLVEKTINMNDFLNSETKNILAQSQKLVSLITLIEKHPFTHYHISYSFSEFGNDSFNKEVLAVCSKIDDPNITTMIASSFNINLNMFFLERVKKQLLLGEFINAFHMLEEETLKIDTYQCQADNSYFLYDSSFSFLVPLSKINFINIENIQFNIEAIKNLFKTLKLEYSNNKQKMIEQIKLTRNNLKPLNIFQNIRYLSHLLNPKPSSEITETLELLLERYCNKSPAVSILASFRSYEKAFNILNSISNIKEKCKVFVHSFFLPVMFTNSFLIFSDFITQYDPDFIQTDSFWDAMMQFFGKHSMLFGIFHIYLIKNQLEDAAIFGMDIFNTCDSFEVENSLLSRVIYCLQTSLEYRKHIFRNSSSPLSSPITPSMLSLIKISSTSRSTSEELNNKQYQSRSSEIVPVDLGPNSTESIKNFLEIAKCQLQITQICVEHEIPFSHDYDIISSDEGALNASAFLYLHQEIVLLEQVTLLKKIMLSDISDIICEKLVNEPLENLRAFWKNMKKHKKTLGPSIQLELLKALSLSKNMEYVSVMIYECFDDKIVQCRLFLEYNFFLEAYSLAVENDFKDLLPLIGHKASLFGNFSCVEDCSLILNNV